MKLACFRSLDSVNLNNTVSKSTSAKNGKLILNVKTKQIVTRDTLEHAKKTVNFSKTVPCLTKLLPVKIKQKMKGWIC